MTTSPRGALTECVEAADEPVASRTGCRGCLPGGRPLDPLAIGIGQVAELLSISRATAAPQCWPHSCWVRPERQGANDSD